MDNSYHRRMTEKLSAAFSPILLEIHDDSASHAGHAGQNPLGESHFSIFIVSQSFENQGLVARHRAIYDVLAEELKERVHALSLRCLTPSEHAKK